MPNVTRTAAERFFPKIHIGLPECCWEWTAATVNGYGHFYADGRWLRAHRWIYEYLIGPIPEGLHIDHLCRNPLCVNPEHLEPVTKLENERRGTGFAARNLVKTHCPQGHAYDDENTVIERGRRHCRTCKNRRLREWRQRQKEPA